MFAPATWPTWAWRARPSAIHSACPPTPVRWLLSWRTRPTSVAPVIPYGSTPALRSRKATIVGCTEIPNWVSLCTLLIKFDVHSPRATRSHVQDILPRFQAGERGGAVGATTREDNLGPQVK